MIFFLNIDNVSAEDFSFSAPDNVVLNSSFEVVINSNLTEIHDVKIYIQNEQNATVSQIENEGWKSSFYYYKSIFPQKKLFNIRAVKYTDRAEICVRLRNTQSQKSSPPICIPIKISLSPIAQELNEETSDSGLNEANEEIDDENNSDIESEIEAESTTQEINIENENLEKESMQLDKIHLNPRNQSYTPNKSSVFITKTERLRLFAVYGFSIFAVILLVLLAWKKL